SVEGAAGGLAASVAASAAIGPYLPISFNAAHLAAIGFVLGVVGQIGDLSESLMKRFCHSKDSGELLPGMGGMLDAVDSILFTAPIFYFHLKIYL
ncbi:MAG: phosphatidate cytidylyltransferase, partial [Candidatus Omnitrophica bacterium]|nr:phosphatidate cytidylyltransferase [Candidatus Omnitrophota bacterium]